MFTFSNTYHRVLSGVLSGVLNEYYSKKYMKISSHYAIMESENYNTFEVYHLNFN